MSSARDTQSVSICSSAAKDCPGGITCPHSLHDEQTRRNPCNHQSQREASSPPPLAKPARVPDETAPRSRRAAVRLTFFSTLKAQSDEAPSTGSALARPLLHELPPAAILRQRRREDSKSGHRSRPR